MAQAISSNKAKQEDDWDRRIAELRVEGHAIVNKYPSDSNLNEWTEENRKSYWEIVFQMKALRREQTQFWNNVNSRLRRVLR